MEIPTELEDFHPHSPENLAQDSGSANPSQSRNNQMMLLMRQMMAKLELRLEVIGDDFKA